MTSIMDDYERASKSSYSCVFTTLCDELKLEDIRAGVEGNWSAVRRCGIMIGRHSRYATLKLVGAIVVDVPDADVRRHINMRKRCAIFTLPPG